jgi:hypothetical protein
MSDLRFDVDVQEIASSFGEAKKSLAKELQDAVGELAKMTHQKTLDLATTELNSISQQYQDAVQFQQLEENLYVISLDASMLWAEEGRKTGFMEELLHGKSSKVGKDGKRYAVIPFEHSKNPTQQTDKARALTNEIRAALKKENVNYRKLEHNPDGSPKLGLLHRFNIDSARLKEKHKDPPLKGVAIYQRKDEKTGKVSRDVMTFRIITEKHREEGKWVYPESAKYATGVKLFEKAFAWAEKEFDTVILPEILSRYN